MGVDIHMFVVENKTKVVKVRDLFDGRNTRWFDNLTTSSYFRDNTYDSLKINYGWNRDIVDDALIQEFTGWGYGYATIKIADYLTWYNEKHPNQDAGWVQLYEAWRYKTKKIYPYEISHHLPKDAIRDDWTFMTFEDPYHPDTYVVEKLLKYITNNEITEEDYIVYCFDC